MKIAKRVVLFLLVNFLVVVTLSTVVNLLGLSPYLSAHGVSPGALFLFCLFWGMGGAFISLALSKTMARWMLGVRLIDRKGATPGERELLELVERLSKQAGLPVSPQVGVYNSKEVNAFATGPTRRRSLVAVSSGLLERLSQPEIEGVLAHEIAHIANGDMVTMTLLQGVVNAFVMFLARMLALAFSGFGKSRDEGSSGSYFSFIMLTFLFEVVFMILGSIVIAFYSRFREYRADAGGAALAGAPKMISALQALLKLQKIRDPAAEKPALAAFKIANGKRSAFALLFSSHPPLEKRIERLEESPS
jgi:heat shock protein HtpX